MTARPKWNEIPGHGPMLDSHESSILLRRLLSYSSKDKAVVRAVAERLRADGLKVWFDDWEIHPGDSIPSKIEEGLERSRVLVQVSPKFGSSPGLQRRFHRPDRRQPSR